MRYSTEVNRVNKLFESCNHCGCSENHCICKSLKKGNLIDKIVILTHGRELSRSNSTGRIIKKTFNRDCQIILWNRVNIDREFKQLMENYRGRTYLIYPKGDDVRPITELQEEDAISPRLFIILDGTWTEVKKMKNRSKYLTLPTYKISSDIKSNYPFRRILEEEGISTIESIIHLLNNTSNSNSHILECNFLTFIKSYNKSLYSLN